MKTITYTLKSGNCSTNKFYQTAENAACYFIKYFDENFRHIAEEFTYSEFSRNVFPQRSFVEYYVELLILAVLWENYSNHIKSSDYFSINVLKILAKARKKHDFLKDKIDQIRSVTLKRLISKDGFNAINIRNLNRFNLWLWATGDYNNFSLRLESWIKYFSKLNKEKQTTIFIKIKLAYFKFSRFSDREFSDYTQSVGTFLELNQVKYLSREDLFSCMKSENEYQLNMICSEMLNIAFKEDFAKSKSKYILAPGCMRPNGGNNCKARFDKLGGECNFCNKLCGISKLAKMGKSNDFQVRILKHSSDLSFWSRKKCGENRGVVGIACVPALLEGGLELRKNDVPAQCVFLNYSGCSKHWCEEDCQTEFNLGRLLKILGKSTLINDNVCIN